MSLSVCCRKRRHHMTSVYPRAAYYCPFIQTRLRRLWGGTMTSHTQQFLLIKSQINILILCLCSSSSPIYCHQLTDRQETTWWSLISWDKLKVQQEKLWPKPQPHPLDSHFDSLTSGRHYSGRLHTNVVLLILIHYASDSVFLRQKLMLFFVCSYCFILWKGWDQVF